MYQIYLRNVVRQAFYVFEMYSIGLFNPINSKYN
ncbi:hypothetical protein QE422_001018 [Chryseobacterium sp. SORGH_AS 447]|nr:hypothetical protein [Chryseobacterium sp. SORGH_AS_0447]